MNVLSWRQHIYHVRRCDGCTPSLVWVVGLWVGERTLAAIETEDVCDVIACFYIVDVVKKRQWRHDKKHGGRGITSLRKREETKSLTHPTESLGIPHNMGYDEPAKTKTLPHFLKSLAHKVWRDRSQEDRKDYEIISTKLRLNFGSVPMPSEVSYPLLAHLKMERGQYKTITNKLGSSHIISMSPTQCFTPTL